MFGQEGQQGKEDVQKVNLSVEFAGLTLKNPVMVASGTFGYGKDIEGVVEDYPTADLGAIILKSVTLEPREGNPPPRTVETYGGLLNSIGLQNVGVKALVEKYLPALQDLPVPIIVNIAGSTVGEYRAIAQILSQASGYSAVEVNISCPNVKEGGMEFGTSCSSASQVLSEVKGVLTEIPVIAKLTPNVTDIAEVAVACVRGGADAVSAINTFSGMAIDIRRRKPILGANYGGLSGPAIKPLALLRVWQIYQRFQERGITAPILGLGGIVTPEDALEFIIAGATAVAVGTANFYDPKAPFRIIAGLREYLQKEVVEGRSGDIRSWIGALQLNLPPGRRG